MLDAADRSAVWMREPNLIAEALERGDGHAPDVARWTARVCRRLDLFEGLLSGREHLFGAFGAADCAAWPFLRYGVSVAPDDPYVFHRALHERMGMERHPAVRDRIARVGRHLPG